MNRMHWLPFSVGAAGLTVILATGCPAADDGPERLDGSDDADIPDETPGPATASTSGSNGGYDSEDVPDGVGETDAHPDAGDTRPREATDTTGPGTGDTDPDAYETVAPDAYETDTDASETGMMDTDGHDIGDPDTDGSDTDAPATGVLDTDTYENDTAETDALDTDTAETDALDTEPLDCPQLGTMEDCLSCGDTCDPEGACMPQGCVAPATVGHATPFGDRLGGPIDLFLWGFPVQLSSPSSLIGLGFYASPPAQATAPAAQVALYSDAGGRPSTLLAAMSPVVGLVAGFHEQSVESLSLPPGTYWLMGTSTGPVPFGVEIAVNDQGLPTFPVAMVSHAFGAPLPTILPNVALTNSHAPNFYAVVLQ